MDTVAIYCRLSEEDRNKQNSADDSASIQNQKTMLLQYAAEQNWKVFDLYSDDDYTGADRNRPQFQRLLQDARQRKFNIVLCKTQSRFTRELELVETYIHGLFPLWGIRFVSIVDHGDTENRGNKKSRQIIGLVNEWYLEDMSENIRCVLTNRRKNGFHIGSFALYGYQKDPANKGKLLIDPEAAEVVREIFSLYAQGYGKTAIARHLNARGIPNPTEYKRQKGLRYQSPNSENSTLWKYATISHMLTNEMYIGNMVQGKYESVSYKTKQNHPRPKQKWYRVEGTHEALINAELWTQVQKLIQTRTKPLKTGQIGLFAYTARCAGCGYVLHTTRSHGQQYLVCPTRHAAQNACVGTCISVSKLEQLVLSEWEHLSEEKLDQAQFWTLFPEGSEDHSERSKLLNLSVQYKKQIKEHSLCLRAVYQDMVRGILDQQEYTSLLDHFQSEKARLEAALAQVEEKRTNMDTCFQNENFRQALLKKYAHPKHFSREMIAAMVDHILVAKRVPGTRDVPVTIYWRF